MLILLVLFVFECRIDLGAFFPINLLPMDGVETTAQLGNVSVDLPGGMHHRGGP